MDSLVRKACAPIGQLHARVMSRFDSAWIPTFGHARALLSSLRQRLALSARNFDCRHWNVDTVIVEGKVLLTLTNKREINSHDIVKPLRMLASKIPNTICYQPIKQKCQTSPLHEIGFCQRD
jgi:IS30 family transposase